MAGIWIFIWIYDLICARTGSLYARVLYRFPLNGGYSEGWGLYSESLGYEFGFYEDPLVRFGHLAAVLFRACRLVVDTGIHALDWDQERAVKYMMDHTPYPEAMIRWHRIIHHYN